MKIEYPCTIVPDEPTGFLVQFTDIEEAFTGGETFEEAVFNASEVLTGILSYRLDNKTDIPLPSVTRPDQYRPAMPTDNSNCLPAKRGIGLLLDAGKKGVLIAVQYSSMFSHRVFHKTR
jgi:predicted RNase H-like HicB family nuclease